MPEPVIETIAAAIATQLATITTANSYSGDAEVVRPKALSGYNPKHGQIVMLQDDRSPTEEGADNRQSWTQPFVLIFYIRPSEDDETAHDTYFNRRAADIEKALLLDDSTWRVAGVVDWVLSGPSLLPDQSESGGGFFILSVDYRHNVGDPYTA